MAIVILHGWSDNFASFKDIKAIIAAGMPAPPVDIHLADWLSLQDDVTMTDLAEAMQQAWMANGLSTTPHAHDVVVHSTGALVVREWMTRYFTPDTVPVKRFVMLAPANFGSGLAHKGQSFIGRAVKGWNTGFQTGTQLLRNLELASPYTATLADRDLFNSNARWYGSGKVLATVLVGDTGYDGIRAIANEDGSDGTVRISTANLSALRVDVQLGSQPGQVASVSSQAVNGDIAFGVLAGHTHGSIVDKGSSGKYQLRDRLLLDALQITDLDYPAAVGGAFRWQQRLNAEADPARADDQLQNTVVYLSDHLGHEVPDYFFEFYRDPLKNDKANRRFEQDFYKRVVTDVHVYGPNKAWRALYMDIKALRALQAQIPQLYISVSATPEYSQSKKQPVGYLGSAMDSTGELVIPNARLDHYFAPHRTVLIRAVIPRYQHSSIFELK
ncbi:MAG: alpha/beta hydrolase [Rhodanobacteraceae bacterium]|nr:alpha/beta hydrolase [Rhodanobacteraceae bacterium]